MPEHSPEPWVVRLGFETHDIAEVNGTIITRLHEMGGANGERAAACVNALAGIGDPAAFVRSRGLPEGSYVQTPGPPGDGFTWYMILDGKLMASSIPRSLT